MQRLLTRLRKMRELLGRLEPGIALRLAILYVTKVFVNVPSRVSYSQTGEDGILEFYLPERSGFYVDVGANDPVRYSNTFNLYLRGWRGLTIEANADLVRRHRRTRRRDLSVCAAVSDAERTVVFYRSQSNLVSTIDPQTYANWKTKWIFRAEDQVSMVTKTLETILEAFPTVGPIDLLSIDVEGHEFAVLNGLDFTKRRPRFIVVEIHDFTNVEQNPVYKFLIERRYEMVAYATMNAYFRALPADRSDRDRQTEN